MYIIMTRCGALGVREWHDRKCNILFEFSYNGFKSWITNFFTFVIRLDSDTLRSWNTERIFYIYSICIDIFLRNLAWTLLIQVDKTLKKKSGLYKSFTCYLHVRSNSRWTWNPCISSKPQVNTVLAVKRIFCIQK